MEKERRFTYKDKHCTVNYLAERKCFMLYVYRDEDRTEAIFAEDLFPVERFSKSYLVTAFHVANRHVLPNITR